MNNFATSLRAGLGSIRDTLAQPAPATSSPLVIIAVLIVVGFLVVMLLPRRTK